MEYLFYGNTREKIEEYHYLSHKTITIPQNVITPGVTQLSMSMKMWINKTSEIHKSQKVALSGARVIECSRNNHTDIIRFLRKKKTTAIFR